MSTKDASGKCIQPLKSPLQGSLKVPGDKSISHRAVLFSAMAEGVSNVQGILNSTDVQSSIQAVEALGAKVELEKQEDGSLAGIITGWGKSGPNQPTKKIDCGNSGTTARLLMGVLAPWDIEVEIDGDESLRTRPMRRITAPLMKMGVQFEPAGKEALPFTIAGNPNLKALDYVAPMASAQLKTAVLLAGIYAEGKTTVHEPAPSRNHTELMLPQYGVKTIVANCLAAVEGPTVMKATSIAVPGDPSSAAYVTCAAVLKRDSSISIEDVSLNTARIGFTRTLERMGAEVRVEHKSSAGKEPYGIIHAEYCSALRGCEIPAEKIASLVDEVPILALVAAHARGVTVFREVGELRVKETDRLRAVVDGLDQIGVDSWVDGNDLFIEGQPQLQVAANTVLDSHNDHRLAMTWAVLGLTNNAPLEVRGFDAVEISYPGFLEDFERLTR